MDLHTEHDGQLIFGPKCEIIDLRSKKGQKIMFLAQNFTLKLSKFCFGKILNHFTFKNLESNI